MGETAVKERKRALRAACARQAALLPDAYLQKANESIADLLLGSELYRRAESVFLYISMEREPATGKIIEHAWRNGKTVYAPLCRGQGKMDAVRITDWGSLKPGRLGILEPAGSGEFQTAQKVDLCVVPCVCADRSGKRLGHGGGYYDRWLKEHAAQSVCLCFDRMLQESVPQEPWDVPIGHILTERGFLPPL